MGLSERWESKVVMRRTWSVVGDFVGLIAPALVVPIAILLLSLPVIGVVRLVIAALASGSATPSSSQATVIQLRLNRDGRGEGKLGTNVTNHHNAKTFVIENFDALLATLVDVQRERSSTATSS